MDNVDKLNFIFNAYDFGSRNSLIFDELTLLLRTVALGLSKISPNYKVFKVSTESIVKYTELTFNSAGSDFTGNCFVYLLHLYSLIYIRKCFFKVLPVVHQSTGGAHQLDESIKQLDIGIR